MADGDFPRMTSGAAERVSSHEDTRAVLDTFHRPHWTSPVAHAPGLLRHRRDDCELRIRLADGVVCFVAFHACADLTGPQPTPVIAAPRPRRRRRGGAGTLWPTTWRELRARLLVAGCELTRRGKHWRAHLPDGRTCTLSATASDRRALRNAARDLAALGIDLRRPTRR